MKNLYNWALTIIAILALASCSNNVKLTGEINGAADQTIQLQLVGAESIQIVDSVKISGDGSFDLEAPVSTGYSFYRAVLPTGKAIVFVADSAETVKVKADASASNWFESVSFDNSEESAKTMQVVAKAVALQDKLQACTRVADEAQLTEIQKEIDSYKSFVKKFIFDNPRSWASYYALYQNVMGMPVFDIRDLQDHKLFSTVATSMQIAYPEDARIKQLCDNVLQARAMQKQQQKLQDMINNAEVANSPELVLPDKDGKMRRLSEINKGKVVILQFWASTEKASRDNNRQLAQLYSKYKSRGLEIYSVSLDTSKLLWEEAMKNDKVTWTSVCDLQGVSSSAPALYNIRPVQAADGSVVVQIPQLFILDKDGSLIGKNLFGKRLDDRMVEIFGK